MYKALKANYIQQNIQAVQKRNYTHLPRHAKQMVKLFALANKECISHAPIYLLRQHRGMVWPRMIKCNININDVNRITGIAHKRKNIQNYILFGRT